MNLSKKAFVREFISKVQTLRKDSGLEVTDHIDVKFSGSDKLADIVKANADEIRTQLLAESLEASSSVPENSKAWNINGEAVSILITKHIILIF